MKPNDTLLVNAAAGAVGSVVGQIGKIKVRIYKRARRSNNLKLYFILYLILHVSFNTLSRVMYEKHLMGITCNYYDALFLYNCHIYLITARWWELV